MSSTPQTECSADGENTALIPMWRIWLVGSVAVLLMVACFVLAFLPHGSLGMKNPDVAAQVCFFLSMITGCEVGAVIGNGRKPLTGEAGRKSW